MDEAHVSAWFAGPKAENGELFDATVQRILQDYYYWRRNYFPEDGFVIDSAARRDNEDFDEKFQDKLMELLGALKADFPFHSPRYAAHMLSEITLPSIAGYFAGMMYNPNNVTSEVAPVTVRLEIEVSQMIARMLGYGEHSWAHLTGGGTVANIEALWVARSVKYLPFIARDIEIETDSGDSLRSMSNAQLLKLNPTDSLEHFKNTFHESCLKLGGDAQATESVIGKCRASKFNVATQGLRATLADLDSDPVIIVPETAHYCLPKAADLLGIGRRSLVHVPVDSHFHMKVGELAKVLDQCERENKHILAVVPVVGTTEEGAIDPVHKIVQLRAEREGDGGSSFWIHADAAYGGYLRTVTVPTRLGLGNPETEVQVGDKIIKLSLDLPVGTSCDALESLSECDSIVVDPHKLGYVPYPAGAVCFRSNLVKPIVRQDAPYLADAPQRVEEEACSESIGVYILEGSKPGAAAASLWLSHSLIPLNMDGHGKLMQANIRNACELHALLDHWPSFTGETKVKCITLCPPGSNIVCYLFVPSNSQLNLEQINGLNREVYRRLSCSDERRGHIYDQRFFISRTVLSPHTYSIESVGPFLKTLGVTEQEYLSEGVFVLRSVLMNPWYGRAKKKGRFFLTELVKELFDQANSALSS